MSRVKRDSARVICLDEDDRVLLLRVVDARFGSPPLWVAPGGGVEPGEEVVAAASRELLEETGLSIPPAALGPLAAVCRGEWEFRGVELYSVESYYVARTGRFDPVDTGWTEIEREIHAGWRWWTCDELDVTTEIVFPAGLAGLIRGLAAGPAPSTPVELPWTSV